jgi:DNA-binding transcriptional LysR family regulator
MTHSHRRLDWDDLKYLLAVARHGSTLAAGRAMAVDQSTVQRRLGELERRVGLPLVRRHPSGYQLTDLGLMLLPQAEAVEQAVHELERRIAAAAADLSGVVRVTCPEPIVYRITQTPFLDRLSAAYPGLQVQFVMSDRYVDLAKGEADVALRSGDTDDGDLVGRKLADSIWAVYASRGYIERRGRPSRLEDLPQHALVGFDDTMARHRLSAWLQTVAPGVPLASRANSVLGLISSVRAGVGVGALPVSLADAEPELVQVIGPVAGLARIWRLLTTAELRRTPRVAAFFDFVVSEAEMLRPILTG